MKDTASNNTPKIMKETVLKSAFELPKSNKNTLKITSANKPSP